MRNLTIVSAVAVAVVTLATPVVRAERGMLQALVGGVALPTARVPSIVVDASTTDVDAATLTVDLGRARPPALGTALEVRGDAASLFKGEIVGIEPLVDAGRSGRVTIRALNRMHRLSRGRKSQSYENQTDAEIVSRIAAEAGLVAGPVLPEMTDRGEPIFQHNQTDLEFLRERAARIGLEVMVDDTTLMLRRQSDRDPTPLGCSEQAPLRRFHPRLSSSSQVSQVIVRGWDPEQQKEVVGKASRTMIGLSAGAGTIVNPAVLIDLGVVQGINSTGSAFGAAIGTLAAITAMAIAAEVDNVGNASLRAGSTVSISGLDARFGGKYHVVGTSHRFGESSGGDWRTLLRLVRVDRGYYNLPEVDDEVLIAFEHGDIANPFIVGSMWNEEGKPQDDRDTACRPSTKRP